MQSNTFVSAWIKQPCEWPEIGHERIEPLVYKDTPVPCPPNPEGDNDAVSQSYLAMKPPPPPQILCGPGVPWNTLWLGAQHLWVMRPSEAPAASCVGSGCSERVLSSLQQCVASPSVGWDPIQGLLARVIPWHWWSPISTRLLRFHHLRVIRLMGTFVI